ncbi:MAG: phosphotransferase [Patescibacteria group bacterium]
MNNESKQKYIDGLKVYHKKLESLIQQSYNVDTEYLEVLSWGYHTTAIYIKSNKAKEYLLKLADWSKKKEKAILKDVDLSNRLRDTIPTPIYIKTLSDNYICRFEDKIVRLSHYISGLAPLDMNFDILGQMVAVLKKIHSFPAMPGNVLLHGDLTPHNILVSFGKIVAVMDFEMSFIGPREWDIARTAFFSWNYMKDTSFERVAQFILKKYEDGSIDADLIYKYTVKNAQKHLESIEKHQNNYERQTDWERDYLFAKSQLKRI